MTSKIFIIHTYPSNQYSLEILEECILRLSNIGYRLMVVSHLPLPDNLQKMVDYFIYDFENQLLESHTLSWYANSSIKVTINHVGHMLAICKNIDTSISTAQRLGYEYFYFIECDNLISSEELSNFDLFLKEMEGMGKSMIFHKADHTTEIGYETKLFGGKTEYFCHNFKLPKSYTSYNEFNITGFLERDFYLHYARYEDDFLIKKSCVDGSLEGFTKSDMNRISNLGIVCEILPSSEGYFIFLLNNTSRELIYFVGNNKIILPTGSYWYSPAREDITIKVVDGEYNFSKNYRLSSDNQKIFHSRGLLEFYKISDSRTDYGSIL
jgi:hypothetical protein